MSKRWLVAVFGAALVCLMAGAVSAQGQMVSLKGEAALAHPAGQLNEDLIVRQVGGPVS